MRHHNANRTLGRTKRQRTALLRGLARSLVLEEGIVTTLAKAKELRPFVERIITTSKKNTLATRRSVAARLGNADDAVQKLHETIAPRYASRAGGYTRIVKLGRLGQRRAEMAKVELVK